MPQLKRQAAGDGGGWDGGRGGEEAGAWDGVGVWVFYLVHEQA